MMLVRDHGSFRDPSGYVAHYGDRIFRILREDAFSSFEWLKSSGFLAELVKKRWLVPTEISSEPAVQNLPQRVLEHEAIDFISYPYEWPFELLRRAALFHLDLHLLALESSFTLIDASAYNVQFIGTNPIFIDPLSLVSYREGEFWLGQRQFCEQFLNPLLLTSLVKIPFNAWYRGSLEGIASEDLSRVLRPKHKLSWRIGRGSYPGAAATLGTVQALESRGRQPAKTADGCFSIYPAQPPGLDRRHARSLRRRRDDVEQLRDREFLPGGRRAAQAGVRGGFHWTAAAINGLDLGCNSGLYSETALRAGARYVVGFDSDHGALNRAVQRSVRGDLKFLPLLMDACNPSPSQGWNQRERAGLSARSKPDAVLALAIEHHIAIGRNVPLPMLLDWMTGLADRGVVEFVPKDDPTVQRMLSIRQDIFDQYSQAEFESQLGARATIEKREVVSSSGRTLYVYEKRPSRA